MYYIYFRMDFLTGRSTNDTEQKGNMLYRIYNDLDDTQFRYLINVTIIIAVLILIRTVDLICEVSRDVTRIVIDTLREMGATVCCFKKFLPCL